VDVTQPFKLLEYPVGGSARPGLKTDQRPSPDKRGREDRLDIDTAPKNRFLLRFDGKYVALLCKFIVVTH
jgi:hypothetical protein